MKISFNFYQKQPYVWIFIQGRNDSNSDLIFSTFICYIDQKVEISNFRFKMLP